jgi:hypothetical protein
LGRKLVFATNIVHKIVSVLVIWFV